MNLTDGLDGLAIGCTIIAAAALTVLTYVSGNAVFSDYLELQRMPMVSEVTVFCGAMVGASIGFLWYNAHPAEVFMGDVGSLALGGAIGTVAVVIKQELLLPFIGGIFVLEAISVILQVGSYKLRKKRIFKMAPLHHHFELMGWSESKVIARFWIARAGVCAVCAHHPETALRNIGPLHGAERQKGTGRRPGQVGPCGGALSAPARRPGHGLRSAQRTGAERRKFPPCWRRASRSKPEAMDC